MYMYCPPTVGHQQTELMKVKHTENFRHLAQKLWKWWAFVCFDQKLQILDQIVRKCMPSWYVILTCTNYGRNICQAGNKFSKKLKCPPHLGGLWPPRWGGKLITIGIFRYRHISLYMSIREYAYIPFVAQLGQTLTGQPTYQTPLTQSNK